MSRVLAVDDDRHLLRALRITLRAAGHEVVTAEDGRSALRAAAAEHPDVVVLDLGLPDLDGTEVLAGLRPWFAGPVLVLSARADSRDKVDALDAGADDYVTKPFDMGELLARLRALVRRGPAGTEEGVVTTEHFTVDLAARAGDRRRRRRPADPDRVGTAVGTRTGTGPTRRPASTVAGGVGTGL